MATYVELRVLFGEGELKNRIEVACIVAARAIYVEDAGTPNHANRLIWAKAARENPNRIRAHVLMDLLAANKDLTAAAIIGVSDAAMQTLVDAAVDMFADGS